MPTVLVVDDLTADRKMAGALLSKITNLSLLYAANGIEALEELELHSADAIVTDLQMPEMNGLDLIETVRKEFPLTPVVMMTARGSEEIAVMALEKGAASYVPKRILSQRLPETVERILAASREEKNQARLMKRLVADECAFLLENDITLIGTLARYPLRHRHPHPHHRYDRPCHAGCSRALPCSWNGRLRCETHSRTRIVD